MFPLTSDVIHSLSILCNIPPDFKLDLHLSFGQTEEMDIDPLPTPPPIRYAPNHVSDLIEACLHKKN